MACIEIKVRDNIFKIMNDEPQSESVQGSDWELIYNFITRGTLPVGYWVEGDNVDRYTLFDTILNSLSNEKTNQELYIGGLTSSLSQDEFINKFVGNSELNWALNDFESYDANQFQRNALVIPSWGDTKNWYGFTKQRALLLTGNNFFYKEPKVKILYKSYLELQEGSSRVSEIISKLYAKEGDTSIEDIYKQLTWLANNRLPELVAALYIPYESAANMTTEEVKDILKTDTKKVVGYLVKSKGMDYIVQSRDEKNTIKVLNLNTGTEETLDISRINKLYTPFTLSDSGKSYLLAGKAWYNIVNGKYIKVDPKDSEDLFRKWFGVTSDTTETIDFYSNKSSDKKKLRYWNNQEPIFSNTLVNGQELTSVLPEGSIIRTSSGIYVKQGDEFVNGDYTLDPIEKINTITFTKGNKELKDLLLTLKVVENEDQILSTSDLRIILHDLFGVTNFDTIFFNYGQEELAKVNTATINGNVVPTLQIGMRRKVTATSDTYRQLKLALNYYMYLNDVAVEKPSEVANPKVFWRTLKDIVINQENLEVSEQVQSTIDQLSSDILDSTNGDIFVNTLERNRAELFEKYGKTEEQVDTFIQELIDKGLYIISCEL